MIKKVCVWTVIFACIMAMTGCTVTRVGLSHSRLREVMLDYTEDQIMDNLIRAKNFLPIIHFDLGSATASITSEIGGEFSGGETEVKGAMASLTQPLNFKLTPKATDALNVNVSPQMKVNKIYELYESFTPFLSVAKRRPSSGVHIGRRWKRDGNYYYVSDEYRKEFFLFCLNVAVLRQPAESADKQKSKRQSESQADTGLSSPADLSESLDIPDAQSRLQSILEQPVPAETFVDENMRLLEEVGNELRLQRIQGLE